MIKHYFCVREKYFNNRLITPEVEEFTAQYAKAPKHITYEYEDSVEHVFVFDTKEEASKHYKLCKTCIDFAYSEDGVDDGNSDKQS